VAEDDQIASLVLKKVLEEAGYRVDFVTDGHEAIGALKRIDYDLVLMDCYMPRMDGFATTRFIRKSNSRDINSKVPVIAMTGLTGKEDRRRCLEAGMNDHVGKPIIEGELFLAIAKCLGRGVDQATISQQGESGKAPVWEDAFLDKLIVSFVEEIPGVIDDLNWAVEREDLALLESIGHRLRGATDILKLRTLSARSRALEQAGKTGNVSNASTIASELIADLQKMKAAVTR
jgi:CheY-like chemotaxis protein/HPt (histidine-containing phosphotransfer) domain-containing protein